jgi:hypothetical protein
MTYLYGAFGVISDYFAMFNTMYMNVRFGNMTSGLPPFWGMRGLVRPGHALLTGRVPDLRRRRSVEVLQIRAMQAHKWRVLRLLLHCPPGVVLQTRALFRQVVPQMPDAILTVTHQNTAAGDR